MRTQKEQQGETKRVHGLEEIKNTKVYGHI
jgi:hypothetical protein